MTPEPLKPVSAPFHVRAKIIRRRVMPLAVWLVLIVSAFYLAGKQDAVITVTGEAEMLNISVAPFQDGILQSVSVELFDTVEQGQTVALMEDTVVRGELIIAEAELGRLRAELNAERKRMELALKSEEITRIRDLRRFALDREEARLTYLDRQISQETDKIHLQRLDALLQRQTALMEENILDPATYDETRLNHAALEKQVAENESALKVAHECLTRVEQRERDFMAEPVLEMTDQDLLLPLRQELDVQEARIAEIKSRRALLVISAPISGRVSNIYYKPGETVLAGLPLLAVCDPKSVRVIAWIPESSAAQAKEGMTARVSSAWEGARSVTAAVLRVGPSIQAIPLHLWRNPTVTEWGRPALIAGIPENTFLPGETLQVKLFQSSE